MYDENDWLKKRIEELEKINFGKDERIRNLRNKNKKVNILEFNNSLKHNWYIISSSYLVQFLSFIVIIAFATYVSAFYIQTQITKLNVEDTIITNNSRYNELNTQLA